MSQATTQKSSSTTAIIFAVFAVACIVAFLWFRGSDVGQLPNLVGNLGGGPFYGPDFVARLTGGLTGIGIGVTWCLLGSLVMSGLAHLSEIKIVGQTTLMIAAALGAAVSSLIWFFLGLAGGYSSFSARVIFGVLVASLIIVYLITKRKINPKEEVTIVTETKRSLTENLLLGAIIVILILSFVAALAPPTAKDALLYHFSVPITFVAQGSNSFIDGNIASFLALGTEMHVVWASLIREGDVGREAARGIVVWLFFPILLRAVYGWTKEFGISRTWSLIATLVVACIPTAYHIASSGYIDLSLALYITLAAYGLTRWWREQTWSWVILIGIFLGAALSVKLTTVFVFAAFALMILLRARGVEKGGKIAASGFAALLLAGVIASPWYIRTWVATGSPVFPFYMSIWPGKANGWDVERSNLFQGMNSQYGGVDTNKINYLTAPVRMSIAAQPEQPAKYDGVLGVAFLIGLPLLVWALWKFDLAVEIKIMSGVAGIMYLFWLFSSEQLRYLLPIAPLLAIAIAASAEKIGKGVGKVARCALIAASICGLLTSIAWFCQKAPLRVVLGGETRDQYLTRNLDYYPYYQWINTETAPDAKVWLINMRRDTYNIERPIFSDYLFEDWTLRKMIWESSSAQEMRSKTTTMGIKYVLTRHDFLFDYDRTTLVDAKKPRAENEAKLKIAKDFILDPANTIKADNKFSLIKVF